jgi:hypothetical protein
MGWCLRSVWPGLIGSGREPSEGLERAAVGEPPGSTHRGPQLGAPDRAEAGQAGGQPGRVGTAQGDVTGALVASPFCFGDAQQADLGGDLSGQVIDRDGAVAVPQRVRLGGGHRSAWALAALR